MNNENKIQELNKKFEHDAELAIQDFIDSVHSSKEMSDLKTLIIVFDEENLILRTASCEKDIQKNYVRLVTISMSLNDICEPSKLYQYLSKQEQSAYLSRQKFYYDNGDFMFYDVDKLMFDYVRRYFTKSYEKYVRDFSIEMSQNIMRSNVLSTSKTKVNNILKSKLMTNDVLERVKKERDELRERREKLYQFLANGKDKTIKSAYQRALLRKQLEDMTGYLNTLNLRIKHWFDEEQSENACVCCGTIIPEGRQFCPNCGGK